MKELTFIGSLLAVFSFCLMAGTHPNMFLNQTEIDAVKAKVSANQEPWKSAYSAQISAANAALNQSLLSVTYTGNSGHDYYTQQPYDWSNNMPSPCGATHCDGYINPQADRADYNAIVTLSHCVKDLGMAYAFTGEARYADKAVALIRTWCLDPATYMTPKYTNYQSYIEISCSIADLFYGGDLIYNYPGWAAADKAAFLQWVASFAQTGLNWSAGNNYENWRYVTLAAAGALTENQTLLDYAFTHWKSFLASQVNTQGQMTSELGRTKSLDYSMFALNPMCKAAEIARHGGVDLYNYKLGDGRGLELALDYHAPYAANPSSWPYQQISAYSGAEGADLYELAYLFKQKSAYLAAINKWGRPMHDHYILDNTTLTHAYGAYPWQVWQDNTTARPVISPAGGTYVGSVQVTITCATTGAAVYYTTDGSTPTTSSPAYAGPFLLTGSATVKALGVKSGLENSAVAAAAFTVTVDNAPPQVSGVSTGGDPTRVTVTFNELVDAATGSNKDNYSISGLTVAAAALGSDGKTVTLTVSTMTEGASYTLTASGIKDRAATPNTMGTVVVGFSYNKAFIDNFDDQRLSWTVTTPSRWSLDADGADHSYHINTTDFNPVSTSVPGEIAVVDNLTADEFEMSVACKSPSSENGNVNRDYGVVLGYTDAGNFWYLLANATAGNNQLFQVINGTRTEKLNLNTALINDNNYHTLKVVVQGGTVAIYQDGVKQGEVSASIPSGQVGICSYNDEVWFDDFMVVPYSTGQTILRMPDIPLGLGPTIVEAGVYSLDGRQVQKDRPSGVYLRVQIINGVKTVQRFVTIGR